MHMINTCEAEQKVASRVSEWAAIGNWIGLKRTGEREGERERVRERERWGERAGTRKRERERKGRERARHMSWCRIYNSNWRVWISKGLFHSSNYYHKKSERDVEKTIPLTKERTTTTTKKRRTNEFDDYPKNRQKPAIDFFCFGSCIVLFLWLYWKL